MSLSVSVRRCLAAAACLAAATTAGLASPGSAGAQSGACTDVEVVFARGSGEPQGLGIVGSPLVRQVKSSLFGRSVGSYAVRYAASLTQLSAGAGATDMTNHVVSRAAQCPRTTFVLGGYSQGASVTDIAIGMNRTLGIGRVIPTNLQSRVGAVAVFGNPSRLFGQRIDRNGGSYAPKAIDDCNVGDPVCGGGIFAPAHLAYAYDGSVGAAARFVTGRL